MSISIKDMIGKRRGIIVIIDFIKTTKKGRLFLCKCDCGNEVEKTTRNFNRSNSCGCVVGGGLLDIRTKNLIGKKFYALTVLGIAEKTDIKHKFKKEVYWKCLCDCGKICFVRGCDLRNDRVKSCKCLRGDLIAETNRIYYPVETSARSVYCGYSDGDLTFKRFMELTQMNCYYCGIKPENMFNVFKGKRRKASQFSIENGDFIYSGLDRVDPKGIHDENNVVPCCKKCNTAKLNYPQDEFKCWIIRLYENYILPKKS